MNWTNYYQSVVASLIVPVNTTCQVILQALPKNIQIQDSCSFYEQVLFKEESLHDISREGYLPGGLYDLDSFYGSQVSLERLVLVLKERGLQVWIDWPLKRRCLKEQDPTTRSHMFVTRPIWTADCLKYAFSSFHRTTSHVGYPKLLVRSTSHNGLDTTIPVDLNNSKVRQDLLQWVSWLENQLSMDGVVCDGVQMEDIPFLLELIKHEESRWKAISPQPMLSLSSPTYEEEEKEEEVEQPSFLSSSQEREWKEPFIYSPLTPNEYLSIALVKVEFSQDSDGRLAYDQSLATEQLFEFIQSTHRSYALIDTVSRTILETALIFQEYWRLIDKEARLVGLLGRASDRAITVLNMVDLLANMEREYVETGGGGWVICKTQRCDFPDAHILKGYAYLLTHPGIPCIHWDHYFDERWRQGIEELIQVRRGCHIHASSTVYIESACAEYYAAFVDKHVAVKIGRGDWHPNGPCWELCTFGWEYAVWKRK
ncbi:Probable alpha-amylase 2 [Galdieria sulphuraria]|nr:Probable alpha-amylase 2 [Galdieria sulphuraria]